MGNPKRLVNTRNCAQNEKFACLDTRIVFWLTQSPILFYSKTNKADSSTLPASFISKHVLLEHHTATYCFTTFTTFEAPFVAKKRTK